MRVLLVGLSLLLAALAAPSASAEIVYPWCRQPAEGGNNCGFTSFEQCMGDSGGRGAFCIENPRFQGPPKAAAPKRRR